MDSFTFVLLIFIAIFGLLGLVFFLIGYLRTRKIHYFDRTEGMIIQKERHFKLNLFQLSKKQTSIHQEGTYSDENPSVAYEVGGGKVYPHFLHITTARNTYRDKGRSILRSLSARKSYH